MSHLDPDAVTHHVRQRWDSSILDTLHAYIEIPNRSPAFDPEWATQGHMDAAVDLLRDWAATAKLASMDLEVVRLEGRTPVILIEIPPFGPSGSAEGDGTVLLYGHLDKQPEMVGWRDGLGPWTPVLDGDRLYGRGGADDGYAMFAALTALEAVQAGGGSHGRCVILIEASEESGSPDLPAYIDHLADRIGAVDLVVCLDSGCGTYDRLWTTTSLRGMVGLTLRVDILDEGVHSGASGVVPSSFRIARSLLSRVEDESTGAILLDDLNVEIPTPVRDAAAGAARVLGPEGVVRYPLVEGARPTTDELAELVLRRTWHPTLSVTGAGGLPAVTDAGNVLRPFTELQLSFRLPPTADPEIAAGAICDTLTFDPPYGARVTVSGRETAAGWAAPPTAEWLADAVEAGSRVGFGAGACADGEGGTIPFMAMLGERFPDAQFLITGVLGPESNAHGPNEFLHIPAARGVTAAVAVVVDAHARR